MINSHQIKAYLSHCVKAKSGGHGVHSPFVYALIENLILGKHSFYAFEDLHALRYQLFNNSQVLEINDLGAGSKKLNTNNRHVKDIVAHGISTQKQSEFYFKLINYFKCQTIIELGTSIGLNTLYFCNASPKGNIYTIEGSKALYDFSKKLFQSQKATNIHSYLGNFDTELPALLNGITHFDLMYIDGNHSYQATINYFNWALSKITPNSIIIIDDIYWSKEMTMAWEDIKLNPTIKMSIDCFYFGMVFFKEDFKQKEHFKIKI